MMLETAISIFAVVLLGVVAVGLLTVSGLFVYAAVKAISGYQKDEDDE
jgi:hypothetical protein